MARLESESDSFASVLHVYDSHTALAPPPPPVSPPSAASPVPKPSVGRIVHYTPYYGDAERGMAGAEEGAALTALVCFVYPDAARYLNLAIFDQNGAHHARKRVPQADAQAGTEGARGRWAWPPRA